MQTKGMRAVPWNRSFENDPYASYAAWEKWMYEHIDEILPDEAPPFMDSLDALHKAYLYNIMTRLAAGEFNTL